MPVTVTLTRTTMESKIGNLICEEAASPDLVGMVISVEEDRIKYVVLNSPIENIIVGSVREVPKGHTKPYFGKIELISS